MKRGMGTQLRHLLELLDGAVEEAYVDAGLTYRPRYTPVFRVLLAMEPATIGQIATASGISQPAVTQTVALMTKDGLITIRTSRNDARQRLVRLTAAGRRILPELQQCWHATDIAAAGLDDELAAPLSVILDNAIAALEQKSFGERIAEAKARLGQQQEASHAEEN